MKQYILLLLGKKISIQNENVRDQGRVKINNN
jgi:hypothetical protein